MHEALHCFAQSPQVRHFSVSITGAKRLNREKKPRNVPTGQIKENHIAYFTHKDDSIFMTDFRIYLNKEGMNSPLPKLEKFGLYELYNAFSVEKLTGKSLVLDSEKAHIVLRKY